MVPKFRAWDKRENTMRDVAVLHFTKGGKVNSIEYWKTPSELKSYHVRNLVLMQSTGLKDKNGVEIFEGDILKIIEVTNEGISEYITDVIWEDCSFVFKSEGVDYYDTFLGAFSGDPNTTYPLFELLVIGNVWDNPELLEGTE
ncbi:YopX family protein [Enterococcus faecalis]|uniref:YopX family protein n=1 Tax=Enterococcus faecalis TaxID=1351 RepID=UPI00046C4FD3|nr:YopX family protein [Enterococcus faecalis]EGO2593028.1 DNA-packaging protein [Enterococcus faecalis]EKR9397657.1 DNA-packaging protein [Enterococcus faecalis]HDV0875073.1 DNA-packaging protein [Enterococcus faecalis]